jgi:hypothetical protein
MAKYLLQVLVPRSHDYNPVVSNTASRKHSAATVVELDPPAPIVHTSLKEGRVDDAVGEHPRFAFETPLDEKLRPWAEAAGQTSEGEHWPPTSHTPSRSSANAASNTLLTDSKVAAG